MIFSLLISIKFLIIQSNNVFYLYPKTFSISFTVKYKGNQNSLKVGLCIIRSRASHFEPYVAFTLLVIQNI